MTFYPDPPNSNQDIDEKEDPNNFGSGFDDVSSSIDEKEDPHSGED